MNLLRESLAVLPGAAGTLRDMAQGVAPRAGDRPHIGLLILFGPEVRAFVYSGLSETLSRRWRVSVITRNPASAVFSTLGAWPVYPAPEEEQSRAVERIRGWSQRLHDGWMRSQGHSPWRHELNRRHPGAAALPSNRTARREKDCPHWLRTAGLLGRSVESLSGDNKGWERLYERLGIDCLVAADYASPPAVAALRAAARKKAATVVLTSSWKDVYAHPYVDAEPGWVGVAGAAEAEYLRRASPHLRPGQVAVVGSLHLERFVRPGGMLSRPEFCRRAGLDPALPFLCYTAASPRTVVGEEGIVKLLLETVERHAARPKVLLRLNPRENGERFQSLRSRFANLVIQRPCWEWDPRLDWNAPLPDDLDEWIATVHHAAFNVSIPSTVTLEFAALGRLTLNVCFDDDPQPAQFSNARFWDAPFYRHIRESPLVAGAFSAAEFREMLECRLAEPGAWKLSPPHPVVSPVERAEQLIESALAARGLKTRSRLT